MKAKYVVIAYVFIGIGMAIGSIGDMPQCGTEPYGWGLPFGVFGAMGVPALLAYKAGKEEK